MEGRLRGNFEAYLVTLATRCFFVCLCFSGQRRTVALKLGVMYEKHLCAVALTGSVRGVHTHPLVSYFLVDPPLLFVYFQMNTGVLSFLD